jgi:acyl-CoA synthetase (NDP forming)
MSDVLKKFQPLFDPKSVAIVGASSNPLKWGFQVPVNLIESGYDGAVYLVNPHESEILGKKVYRSVREVPERSIDLAMGTVPAHVVLDVVKECANAGVKAMIVITAGFSEVGKDGAQAEAELARTARDSGMLLVGPNCAGVVSPYPKSLYCLMAAVKPQPGTIAMASQSGNVGHTILNFAVKYHIGISRFISTGNEALLRIEDYIEYFGDDPRTNTIAAYIEGVDDGRRFLSIARDASRKKPIVVLKVGGTEAGKRAARSHTGALAGSREIFHGACRQAGLAEVADTEELFDSAASFARQPLPRGKRVAIVSEGGGWGVLAADACAEFGLDVVPLPENALKQLDAFLPAWWSRSNPVDLVGGLVENGLPRAAEVLLQCDEIDGVIALGVGYLARRAAQHRNSKASGIPSYEQLARAAIERDITSVKTLADLIDRYHKPVIVASDAVFTVYEDGNEALFALLDAGVYVYPTPRRAARAFAHLADRSRYMASIGADPASRAIV